MRGSLVSFGLHVEFGDFIRQGSENGGTYVREKAKPTHGYGWAFSAGREAQRSAHVTDQFTCPDAGTVPAEASLTARST